jgi:Na+/citrate or Na+/malate symporter
MKYVVIIIVIAAVVAIIIGIYLMYAAKKSPSITGNDYDKALQDKERAVDIDSQ